MANLYDFIIKDVENNCMDTVFYDGKCSLWDVSNSEFENGGNELEEEETLSNYFEPKIIEEYITEIINDNEIYNAPIEFLVEDYRLYDLLNEKFDAEINK